MERRLHEAAIKGSVCSLLQLLEEDPLVLDRVIVACVEETPLHIAAMLGHFDFAREILRHKPKLASENDSQQLLPLHLASANGYVEIVKELLRINSEACLARDRDGRTPIHLAAKKGRIEVLRELIRAKPESSRILGDQGETILHFCVKHNQLEALKLLMDSMGDSEFAYSKDDDGNTILHLAVADKHIEMMQTVKFLLGNAKETETINILNRGGLTALDLLERGRRDLKDIDIGELLREAGAKRSKDIHSDACDSQFMRIERDVITETRDQNTRPGTGMDEELKKLEEWVRNKRNALMVVASLIATMAFQAVVNPPGGVWQDDKPGPDANRPSGDSQDTYVPKGNRTHFAGMAIIPSNYPDGYPVFLAVNTISFIASLSIILLIISGLPMRHRIFTWILMVIMWIAITTTALTYQQSVLALTEEETRKKGVYAVLNVFILSWASLMGILFLAHTIRLVWKLLRKCVSRIKRAIQRAPTPQNPSNV